MYIYRSDEMATKGSDSSKYQSTTCSLLDLSSLAITTSVIVPTPYRNYILEQQSEPYRTQCLLSSLHLSQRHQSDQHLDGAPDSESGA
jgi:hypothetical protein